MGILLDATLSGTDIEIDSHGTLVATLDAATLTRLEFETGVDAYERKIIRAYVGFLAGLRCGVTLTTTTIPANTDLDVLVTLGPSITDATLQVDDNSAFSSPTDVAITPPSGGQRAIVVTIPAAEIPTADTDYFVRVNGVNDFDAATTTPATAAASIASFTLTVHTDP